MKQPSLSPNSDRFRGWILMALYGSLTILCFMLLYALFLLQGSFADRTTEFYATGVVTIIAAGFNARATTLHFKITMAGQPLPRLALKPFLFMAIALLFAGRLFGGI